MLQIIHIIVALIAALTVTILSLYQDVTFYLMCIRLVIVIPVFFVLGLIFRYYLTKLLAPPPEPEENTDGESLEGIELDDPEDLESLEDSGETEDTGDYIS